jgi:hypothetical protein
LLERGGLPLGCSRRNRRVRRPEEAWADADRTGQSVVRQAELKPLLPAGKRGDIGVREGVVAELEAVAAKSTDHVRMADDLAADNEEGRRRVQAAQRTRDPRRPSRVGAVVEREGDPLADRALAGCQSVTAPRKERPLGRERPVTGGEGRRAAAGRPCRKPLRPEQDGQNEQQQAEDDPAGSCSPGAPGHGLFLRRRRGRWRKFLSLLHLTRRHGRRRCRILAAALPARCRRRRRHRLPHLARWGRAAPA